MQDIRRQSTDAQLVAQDEYISTWLDILPSQHCPLSQQTGDHHHNPSTLGINQKRNNNSSSSSSSDNKNIN